MIASFIIPHKGRTEMLRQTIQSILELDFDRTQFEILVVTQNEAPLEDDFDEASQNQVRLFVQPEDKTISALRNFGVSQCKGEYVAFLDADIQLSRNWLTTMLSLLEEDSNRVLVSAMQINSANAPPLERIRTALSNAELDCNVRFLPGRNLFLSKSRFLEVGGFPEHLVTCEDYYFTDKVHELGALYYSSRADYVHLGEDKELKAMFDKEIWRGQSNLQSISGRHIPLSEFPSFLVPIWIFLFTIVAFVSIALMHWSLALSSVVLVLLPVLLYSIRLYGLAKEQVSFYDVFKFYLYYFPARVIGTIGGLFKTITANNKA